MKTEGRIRLGRTEFLVDRDGFGALPIQRISDEEAVHLLRRAREEGINFFDTARAYSDSEHKLGLAFSEVRDTIYIATKSMAQDGEKLKQDLETSLQELQTEYIDLYQVHNPSFCPKPGGEDGIYDALLEAKAAGKIRHIGITNHRLAVAEEAIDSGLYETLQFPLSYLSTEKEEELVRRCEEADMGFISMKALAGGLIHNMKAAYAYQHQFLNVIPIWGIQKEEEFDQLSVCREIGSDLTDDDVQKGIEEDRRELTGDFCRGCGYCMPCPVGIEINNCARISLMIRRAPEAPWLSEEYQEKMKKIEDCIECGSCREKCPYDLDTPALLKRNLEEYYRILKDRQKGK